MKATKKLKKLQGIGATRVRLGLTQELFALELGLSRSLLCKVENRQRSLPLTALSKLAEMEKRLSSIVAARGQAIPAETLQNVTTTPDDDTRAPSARYELQLQRLQEKLIQMQQSYAALGVSLDCMEGLMNSDPGYPSNEGSVYLQIQCFTLQCKRNKCGLPAQASLQFKIHLLKAAVALQQDLQAQLKE